MDILIKIEYQPAKGRYALKLALLPLHCNLCKMEVADQIQISCKPQVIEL
ncbi:MAG: hypothetical protein IPL13_00005 [Saprospiraceae bacterium]|nr:hypothetical protein [Candidatus Brachybacter algidus]